MISLIIMYIFIDKNQSITFKFVCNVSIEYIKQVKMIVPQNLKPIKLCELFLSSQGKEKRTRNKS